MKIKWHNIRFLVLSVLICAQIFVFNMRYAQAYTVFDPTNYAPNYGSWLENMRENITYEFFRLKDESQKWMMPAMKVAAIIVVQKATQAIVGGSQNGGKPMFVRDWNQYLNLEPRDRALSYMNEFFNGASSGRLAGVNYEGVSNGAVSYETTLAKTAMATVGQTQSFQTTMSEYTSDPQNMFSDGSMRAFMAYTECANNYFCYNSYAQNVFQNKFQELQTLADRKQVNGILGREINGLIAAPATFFENMMTGVDQMLNTNLATAQDYQQVIAYSGMQFASSLFQYQFGTDSMKDKVQTRSDQKINVKFNPKIKNNQVVGNVTVNGTKFNLNSNQP